MYIFYHFPLCIVQTAAALFLQVRLWYLGFILVLEHFSMFIFQDLRVFQQLEFNYII